MPRMIRTDCPTCDWKDSFVVAFGEPYADFGDGFDDSDFRVEIATQECECHPDDTEAIQDIVRMWHSNCYPSAISGEWSMTRGEYAALKQKEKIR